MTCFSRENLVGLLNLSDLEMLEFREKRDKNKHKDFGNKPNESLTADLKLD